jgi:starvation-inducible DNA-binding protein
MGNASAIVKTYRSDRNNEFSLSPVAHYSVGSRPTPELIMAKQKNNATTRIDIKPKLRDSMTALLNQQLADTLDLYTQVKQAHWNVKGPRFIMLHELFDKLAEELEEPVDDIAERITALGGIARGTARDAAARSRLKELGRDFHDLNLVGELADRYAALAASTRAAIETAAKEGDADTSDLFTGISRELDKALWFLESHLV